MDPAAWRKREKLTVRGAAKRLGIKSAMSVLRYESGEREAPNSVAIAYERESGGEVSAEDLNRVRKRFLRMEEGKSAA